MVYVTGDIHGEQSRMLDRNIKRLKKNDTLIVLGDFGFVWDNSEKEKKFLKYLGSRRYNVCFLDGTHENYDLLYQYPKTIWKGGLVHRINNHLFHLCRGQVFTIDGLKIFTFGGGESLDRDMHREHQTWWREELPSKEELSQGVENLEEAGCEVDYILTHEPPALIKGSVQMRLRRTEQISALNAYLEEISRSCTYKKWFYGSCHEDKIITLSHIGVYREVIPLEEAE